MKLIIRERSDDYHVHLEGRPDIWGCGKSEDEALGDWLRTHGEQVGVSVEHDPPRDRRRESVLCTDQETRGGH